MLERLGQHVDFPAHTPVHALYLGPCAQVYDAVAEEVECLLAYLLSIVPVFEHGSGIEIVPDVVEVFHQLVVGLLGLKLLWHLRQRSRLEHVDDEHGVVGRQRASALGDDVGMGDVVLVGCIDKGVDAVVHVFLNGVVHRTLTRRRACSVVVHPEAAPTVHKVYVIAHLVQVDVELCRFAERRLYAPDFRYLASDVEVDEAQAVV